jgi:hypothetical protein
MTEEIRRVVIVLHSHKPLVIRPVGGFDALRTLVGLQADLVDVIAARGGRDASALLARASTGRLRRLQPGPASSTGSPTRTALLDG